MAYLVLARKYRPQTFEEIVGQEHVTKTLKNAIAQERLHHAFLFTGARGVGKTTAARILAKTLSCVNAPTPTPCNVCEACVEITAGSSVDVQEIDAASNNGVDNIRELRESIRYAPVRGKKKVYILDEVHMLSSGAWNALLKTLEEPPPHAVFVFATTDPHKLPATILSRVQRYDFKLVPIRRIIEHLSTILSSEKIAFEPGALTLVAREAGGSVRDSLSLLDQVIASTGGETLSETLTAEVLGVADRALLAALGSAVLARDAGAALAEVDAAFTRGYDLPQLAHSFLAYLRDWVVVKAVKIPAPLVDVAGPELEQLKSEVARLPAGLPEMLFDRFAKITEEVSRSPVPRFVLEIGFVELTRVEPLEPIAELVTKLEALEARLEQGRASRPLPEGGSGGGSERAAKPRAQERPSAAPIAPKAHSKVPENFTELVEAILAIDPMLSSLAQGRLLAWDEAKLAVGFDKEFAADGVRERLPALKSALQTVLGKTPSIEIVVGPTAKPGGVAALPGSETLIEVEQRKLDEDRERRRNEALTHPVRKMLDEKFGGTWKDPVVDLDNES